MTKWLAICLLSLATASNAQTALDKRPSSSSPAFENLFDARKKAQEQQKLDAAKAAAKDAEDKLAAFRTRLNEMGARTIQGKVLSVVKPGEQVLVMCGANYRSDPKSCLSGELKEFPRMGAPDGLGDVVVLLHTPPALGTLVDGDPVNVIAGPLNETYQYRTALGASATVRVYGMVLKK